MGTSSATVASPISPPSSVRRHIGRWDDGSAYPSRLRKRSVPPIRLRLGIVAILHEAPAEAALDTEVALGDRVLERRRRLHDLTFVDVQGEGATHATERTDRIGLRHARLVPRPFRSL